MTATLPRSHLGAQPKSQPARAAVTLRWHELRRLMGLTTAALAVVSGLVLVWPAMSIVAILALGIAGDATLALRSSRRSVEPTLVADISFTGFAMILSGVPPVAIGVTIAYFVLVIAVLGRSNYSWTVGLYAVMVGAVVSFAPLLFGIEEPVIQRSLAAGIIVVAVFGASTVAMVKEFSFVRRKGNETTGRRIEIAGAISDASRVLVADDDPGALAKAVQSIREVLGSSVVFVERNIEDPELGPCAVVVDRSVDGGYIHPSIERAAKVPWSSMPGAMAHLEGGAPFFYRVEEARGSVGDRGGEAGLQVEVNIPIMMNREWVGVIGAGDYDSQRVWVADDLVLLRTLAGLTAAFWQRAEDAKVRDSLIGSLDGRLRFEEALARSSRALLGESSADLDPALNAIGLAAKVDELVVSRTIADDDGEPVAEVLAAWSPVGTTPGVAAGTRTAYADMPVVRDQIQRGEAAVAHDDHRRITAGIEVNGAWFGSVEFMRIGNPHGWSQRTFAFIRTIADMLGAFYERAENRSRLEASLAQKDQLIASVSHELRTPLTAVVGLAEELMSPEQVFTTDDRLQILTVIADESKEMADLVEDLLVAARTQNGDIPVFPERVDLALLARYVRSHISVPDHVELRIDDEASVAYADPVRVRQVIRNLLTNAFRYGGAGVTVTFGVDGDAAYVEVHDDGSGIAREDRAAIFEPYSRASGSTTHKSSVGLGLTLSKRLAELMSGSLAYIDGDGCTFRLTVPLPPVVPEDLSQDVSGDLAEGIEV